MEVIDLDVQGHLAISTQETAFNVTLVHWSRLAKGCYTSQTCSCFFCQTFVLESRVIEFQPVGSDEALQIKSYGIWMCTEELVEYL